METCIVCNSSKISKSVKTQFFNYNQIKLHTKMPVFTCSDCGYEFFDADGEVAREKATLEYIRLVKDTEIVLNKYPRAFILLNEENGYTCCTSNNIPIGDTCSLQEDA